MSSLEQTAQLLEQSLSPQTAHQAEQQLRSQEETAGFPLVLLNIVAATNLSVSTRLASALYFKNLIKRKWVDENGTHLLPDAAVIKSQIIDIMISLPNNLQIQIGESISIIADSDFPHQWTDLIDILVSKLSNDDFVTNKGVLQVAHSIFKRWRPLFRSDELFLEIKSVLEKFSVPFLNLLVTTDKLIDSASDNPAQLEIYFQVLLLLVKIYFDLNCQDIPEFFEDNLNVGMEIIHKYLIYSNPVYLKVHEDDNEEVDTLTKIKTSICELIQLYTIRYEDILEPFISKFIQTCWNLLTTINDASKYDLLVSKLLNFLTSIIKNNKYFEIFNNEIAIKEITEKIIIPNLIVRESDEELFEDDPIEYIRRDLEGSDFDSRRKSTIDFLKELKFKNENLIISIIIQYISSYLQQYQSNPQSNWKFKDLSIYLFTALAVKSQAATQTSLSGTAAPATTPNTTPAPASDALNVVSFFTENIVSDLLNDNIHPILKVDSIKYIYLFRNQLTKQQLLESFPILSNHLNSDKFIEYTYSAITIEKILSIKDVNSKQLIFNKEDLKPFINELINHLFKLILKDSNSPEKLAENEFLMKCVMRLFLIAEDSIEQISLDLINQLCIIINIIAKNPSNPKFNHYTFESISLLIKFNHKNNFNKIVEILLANFLPLLNLDIQEFMSYIFQILSYLIEISSNDWLLTEEFKQLSEPLLSPQIWEFKGNIPPVTRLIIALINKDYNSFKNIEALLGVFQKLISSKVNDNYGFELLESIINKFPIELLVNYLKPIGSLLLTRLQNFKTEKFIKKFTLFLCKLTIFKDCKFSINFINQVQSGLFEIIFKQILLPSIINIENLFEKKIIIFGLTNFLIEFKTSGENGELNFLIFQSLISICSTDSLFISTEQQAIPQDFIEMDEISSFGSNYSRLSSIVAKPFDPLNISLNESINYFIKTIKSNDFNEYSSNLSPELVEKLKKLVT